MSLAFKIGGTWRGVNAPKRHKCPECKKKGIGPWKLSPPRMYRECRYCLFVESKSIHAGEQQ